MSFNPYALRGVLLCQHGMARTATFLFGLFQEGFPSRLMLTLPCDKPYTTTANGTYFTVRQSVATVSLTNSLTFVTFDIIIRGGCWSSRWRAS